MSYVLFFQVVFEQPLCFLFADFFYDEFKERQFLSTDENYESTTTEVTDLKLNTMYTRGHSKQFYELIKKRTGKESPKVYQGLLILYFGCVFRVKDWK